jgi:hypothetical protein
VIDAETRAEIEALITEFSFRIDHGDAAGIPELFTEKGSFESPAAKLHGKTALTAAMTQRAKAEHQTRHVISNLRLQQESSDQLRGTVILTMYRWTPGDTDLQPHPVALVEYEDLYERGSDGTWRFASRKAQPVLPPA